MTSIPQSDDTVTAVVALYAFGAVADPEHLRTHLDAVCRGAALLGTLLIAPEGVNGTLAGPSEGLAALVQALGAQAGLAPLELKYATADVRPFHRLKVRVKPEIVTLGRPDLDFVGGTGVHVDPVDWNALIRDPDTIVIDTRNDYEVEIGTFEGAINPRTPTFRDFPDWFEREGRALLAGREGSTRVAMFCTGGIRCEKATALLRAEGLDRVFHLKGGILKYLETVPSNDSLWRGECFVFDERVAVGQGLGRGSHSLCRGCRMPVSAEGRRSLHYVDGVCCDRCHGRDAQRQAGYAERQRQAQIAASMGIAHVGARLTPSQPLPLLDVEPSGGQESAICVIPKD